MRESGEMYLETILVLGKEKNIVRATDIASRLGYSKASVSRAVGKLCSEGYIVVGGNGYIAFTEQGRSIAEKIYERHHMATSFQRGRQVESIPLFSKLVGRNAKFWEST